MRLACDACRVSFTLPESARRRLAAKYDAVACPRCGVAMPLSLAPAHRVLALVESRVAPGADPPGLHEATRHWNAALLEASRGPSIDRQRIAWSVAAALLGVALVVVALRG